MSTISRNILLIILSFVETIVHCSWSTIINEQAISTIELSADFAGTALINNLSDLAFTSLNPVSALSQKENVCVYANSLLGGTYSITATGNGVANAFTVSNGSATVPYSVSWAATANASSGTALTTGVELGSLNTGVLSSICLLGITNSTLFVAFSSTALQNATAGSFTGVLTLLITPA